MAEQELSEGSGNFSPCLLCLSLVLARCFMRCLVLLQVWTPEGSSLGLCLLSGWALALSKSEKKANFLGRPCQWRTSWSTGR